MSAGDVSLNAGLRVASDSSFNANIYVGGSIVNPGLISELALKAPLASPSFTGSVVSSGDVSLNAGLRVASDSSFNANIYVGGSIVNTGLTNSLALKAPLASPSFTGSVVSAGDVSLNAGLRVASDSSFNANIYVGGSIVNTGLTNSLALKAPIASPSFTGSVVSTGDVSLNAGLRVASDSSFNSNLFVGGSIVNAGLTNSLALKAPLASPSFTGSVVSTGDVSLNAGLRVASDSSFNANIYVGGSIVNTGLSSALALKAPLASPSFTGSVVSAGDVSLNAGLRVASDSSFNANLFIGGSIVNAELTSMFALVAPSASPSFSGIVESAGDVSMNAGLRVAYDSSFNGNLFVNGMIVNTGLTSALGLKAPLASPSFTGSVVSAGDVSLNANLSVAGSIVNTGLSSALGLKAPLESPALTGTPIAPTATLGTNTTQIATTQYVRSEISALIASAPGTLDTLNELATALGNDAAFSTTVTNSIALKAPLASPTFTGAFLVSSADASFNGNLYVGGSINNTGLSSALALKAPLASPSFTGSLVSAGDVSMNAGLRVASDSSFNANIYVAGSIVNTGLSSALGLKAPLASPSFTGAVVSAGDVSLNAGLRVASDSSFNANLFVGGSIVNTGLSSALGLKAPLASPSFTGSVVSAGDVSMNAGLRVASDSSFNANLFIGGSIVNTGLSSTLALKAPLESPSLTGTPIAPTATLGTNTTQIATTAYVRSEISALVASAPAALDTLNELATALGNDAAFSTTVTNSLGLKAPLASPTFTGAFLVTSADSSFNGNLYVGGSIVNTGLSTALGLKAPIASPSFTGSVVSAGDVSLNAGLRVQRDSSFNGNLFIGGAINNTGLSTALGLKANIAAPSFTGTVVSTGDVSFNANLTVARDSSFNGNLYIGRTATIANKATIGMPPTNDTYEFDLSGHMRIYETVGTAASATNG